MFLSFKLATFGVQFTRIPFASSAFYRLGTVIFGCITRNMQPTTLLHVSPYFAPTGDMSTRFSRRALSCIPLSTPVRHVVYMFLRSHYLTNLIYSLFVLFCITKIQLIFYTPKFLSSFLSKNLTFFCSKDLLKNECCILYNTSKPKKQTNILKYCFYIHPPRSS